MKSPESSVQENFHLSSKNLLFCRIELGGKLHGGNDLCKAILYPRLIFKGERFGTVVREVGHGAYYTAPPNNPGTMDLQVCFSP